MSRLLLFASALLILGGCASTTTLERRIAADPDLFESLSTKHQALVREGRVVEGMSKDAVRLAWGRPHEVKQGSSRGRSLETWVYYGSDSVPVQTIGLGYGYGYYGPGAFYDAGYDLAYRDYVAAKAQFEGGRVVSWELNRR